MRGSLDPACGWRETQPISILSLLDPRAFDLQNFPFSQANRDGYLNNPPEFLSAFELSGIVLSHLADERQLLWFCDSGPFFRIRQFDMLQRVSVQNKLGSGLAIKQLANSWLAIGFISMPWDLPLAIDGSWKLRS
ncbi:MAG: hypothetical protein WAS50_06810, partial [Nitrospira sp.]